ncbi:ATP-grasp domain-containing protein [Kitasatospora sp. NBC_01250]|uniref:ATP-grasp domain-containing protein n=1 Tax=Kitasatospora sp. NBC_01250 TaxID=2903571 RepID=UPI002E34E399|nr:ATP-grasp domain-containing protein [Kitasatospora sp. NBC_01250]
MTEQNLTAPDGDPAAAPRIAVIGGTPATLRKVRAAGFEVVWIHGPQELDTAGLAHVAEAHLTDYRTPDAVTGLLTAVHRLRPLVRVVSMIEDGLESAAAATTALGLPGNGLETVRVLQDKLAFRTLLAERGIESVAARIGHTAEDIRSFVDEHGPAVIKPRFGSGSLGVRLVEDAGSADETGEWAAGFGLHSFLMEQYLSGTELSVETFSYAGRHVVLAFTAKEKLASFVEIGHTQPAGLDPRTARQVEDLVSRTLDAVGLADGPAHTEVILTDDGPRLVESHSRRGGDRIADLVQEVYGIDTDALAFLWYAGRTAPVEPGEPRCGAAIRFLTAEPGVVESVEGLAEVLAHPDVVDAQITVAPGDTVVPVAWSYDRCGLVLSRGADGPDAAIRASALAARISIRTRPAEHRPPERTLATIAPRPDRLVGTAPIPSHDR